MSKQPVVPAGRVISLSQTVAEIKRAIEEKDGTGPRAVHSPFFLIVGAGISYPQVPLAKDIEQLCRQHLAKTSPSFVPPEAGSPFQRYAASIEAAYPNAEQRRAFLHGLMRSVRLSSANLRLAHLLGEGRLTNMIFTPNFDEMLSQALRFLGYPVIVCDHPAMTGRLDALRDEIQIVHVHGTHWFYDLRNLPKELKKAAGRAPGASLSLPEFLASLLHHRSPLVVGYSGWEGDVLMTSLKRRLQHPLGSNLYWFCYRRSDLEALPAWLKGNEDVRFVLETTGIALDARARSGGAAALRGASLQAPERASGTEPGEPVLTARRVFEELIVALGLPAPELSQNPLGFLETHLKRHLDPEDGDGDATSDPFLIRSTLAKIRRAVDREREEEDRQEKAARRAGALLDEALDAVRRSDYAAAVAAAGKVDLAVLRPDRRFEMEEALEQVYLAASDQEPTVGLAACETRLVLSELALAERPDLVWRTSQAKAMHGKGYCLGHLHRLPEGLAAYDAIIDHNKDAQELPLQERVARALYNKGVTLSNLGRPEEGVATFDELLERFGFCEALVLQEQVARALYNKGVTLGDLGRPEVEVATYEELLRRFGPSEAQVLQEQVARALNNRGVTLRQLGRSEEALASYEELLRRFGSSEALVLQEQVASALNNRGFTLGYLGRSEEELAICEELLTRFGTSEAPVLQEQVARALTNKGVALCRLGRHEDSLAACEELLGRVGHSEALGLQEAIAKTLYTKGFTLSELGRYEEGVVSYEELLGRFGPSKAPVLQETVAKTLYNKGLILSELGRHEEALASFEELLGRFGPSEASVPEEPVIRTLHHKGILLQQLGRETEAIAAYETLIQRFKSSANPELRALITDARRGKALILSGQLSTITQNSPTPIA